MIPDKLALRARLRAERDRFASESESGIMAPPEFLDRLRPGLVVTSYIAVGSEADPTQLAAAAAERGCRLALPHVTTRVAPMRFLVWDMAEPLAPGPMGLKQPRADAEEVVPDIIITPLVGYDSRLDRLGQGAGFYDRAFARFPDAWRVGCAWSVQEVPAIPTDIWDVPLHAVITERGMLWHPET
jgi:5-formyltetrahydrofolate cyclo-ligase